MVISSGGSERVLGTRSWISGMNQGPDPHPHPQPAPPVRESNTTCNVLLAGSHPRGLCGRPQPAAGTALGGGRAVVQADAAPHGGTHRKALARPGSVWQRRTSSCREAGSESLPQGSFCGSALQAWAWRQAEGAQMPLHWPQRDFRGLRIEWTGACPQRVTSASLCPPGDIWACSSCSTHLQTPSHYLWCLPS